MTEQCKMLYKAMKQRNGHTKYMHTRHKILSVESYVDENRIQIEKVTRTAGTNRQSMNVHCIR